MSRARLLLLLAFVVSVPACRRSSEDPASRPEAANGLGALPEEAVTRLQHATALVRTPDGSGSAFVASRVGNALLLVTNDHVVRPKRGGAAEVEIVLRSGEPGAQARPGRVLQSSKEQDLAVVLVDGTDVEFEPLVARSTAARETEPVIVIGYPFDRLLAAPGAFPSPTLSRGSISSLRRTKEGEVGLAQIDGDINPGNSGGPVVDTAGALVGVAVAKIEGTGIGFMIPADRVEPMLRQATAVAGAELAKLRRGEGASLLSSLEVGAAEPPTDQPANGVAELPVIEPSTAAVMLPGRVDAVAEAGRGRYLILKLRDQQKAAVLDLKAKRVVGELVIPDAGFLLAAGDMTVLAYLPRTDKLVRYNLQTLAAERTVANELGDRIVALGMGRARGDLAVVAVADDPPPNSGKIPVLRLRLFDVVQMAPVEVRESDDPPNDRSPRRWLHPGYEAELATDATLSRSLLTLSRARSTADVEFALISLRQGVRTTAVRGGSSVLADDGRLLRTFAGRAPEDDADGRPVPTFSTRASGRWAAGADSTMALFQPNDSGAKPDSRPRIFVDGRDEPIALFSMPLEGLSAPELGGLSFVKRVHFLPREGLLAVIPPSSDRVVIYSFDADVLARAAGAKGPLVLSTPPASMHAGGRLAYSIDAQTASPPLQFTVIAGPSGLAVSSLGRVTWDVPDPAPASGRVVIRLVDGASRSFDHAFDFVVE